MDADFDHKNIICEHLLHALETHVPFPGHDHVVSPE